MMRPSKHNEPVDTSRGHETSDAHFKSVVLSGVGLFGLMIFGLLVSLGLLTMFKARTAQPGAHPDTFVQPKTNDMPPKPNLQSDPHAMLLALRASEDSVLNSYGKAADDSTVVRIPIERAMALLVKKGLPVQSTNK